ncbi:MAG: Gfo/Idh/MocA family protein [Pelagimonas sp.]|uniref:Gfo/Idh/MocA family protein n=1 Tax=Pelagimonas sp. TaxID=2073170 RepID=UPI003D6A2BC4
MNWALIGTSTIAGQYMIGAIRSHAGADITWVQSSSAARAKAFSDAQGIASSTSDLTEVLTDPDLDAVYISSTNEKHFAQSMAAIEAGKHVLCEKPLATDIDQAITMVRAAETAGVTFATNHHLRCAGSHRAMREIIQSGRIGRVLSLRLFHAVELPTHLRGWRLDDPKAGGGVIADLTVHNADVARFLLDEDPQTIVAQSCVSGLGQGVEDSAMSVWSIPSGTMVFSHESFTHPHAGSGIEVHGTKGSVIAKGVFAQDPTGTVTVIAQDAQETISFSLHSLYVEVIRDFCNCVASGKTPSASGWDGVKSMIIADTVKRAADTGVAQTVDFRGAP